MVKKEYQLLDILKFVLAVLIVALHCDPFLSYNNLLQTGFRNIVAPIAVPCFFIISSFLFFEKIKFFRESDDKLSEKKYVLKYARRLIFIYLFWSLVYFPFVIVDWVTNGFNFLNVLIYLRNFFFNGSYSTLWFLPALLTGTLITYFLGKIIKNNFIRLLIPVITYLFCISGTTYYGIFSKIPYYSKIIDSYLLVFGSFKNGILFAFLPITLGSFISAINSKYQIKFKLKLLILFVLFVFYALESFLLTYFELCAAVDEWILVLPVSFMIVWITISVETNAFTRCVLYRKLSILMFLTQRIPLTVFSYFSFSLFNNSFVYFLVVLIVTIGMSFGIIKLSDKIRFFRRVY